MTESLNFTQFCCKYGYPSDYDMMFDSQYNGSLGLAGHVSNRTIKRLSEQSATNRNANNEAHEKYVDAILNDEVIDTSGEYVKEKILAERKQRLTTKLKEQIAIENTHIDFIKSLGKMSHTQNGKLRKNYQLQVDIHQQQISKLNSELLGVGNNG